MVDIILFLPGKNKISRKAKGLDPRASSSLSWFFGGKMNGIGWTVNTKQETYLMK